MAERNAGKSARSSRGNPTTPEDFPVNPPQQLPGADYSFTVELVDSINRELGKLTAEVSALKDRSKAHAEKIDKLSHTVYGAKVGLWIIGGIVAAAGSACGFILRMIF